MKTFFFSFGLHVTLDRKNELILGVKIFILDFLILKFSESPGPPPLENPAYATGSVGVALPYDQYLNCRGSASPH